MKNPLISRRNILKRLMQEGKELTIGELRKCKEAVEKMRSARTEQHMEPVFEAVGVYEGLLEGFSVQPEPVQRFFFSDLLIPSVNFLVNYKSYPGELASRVEGYFKRILRFLVEEEDHLKLSEAFRSIMDPARMFYQHNCLEKSLSEHHYVTVLISHSHRTRTKWRTWPRSSTRRAWLTASSATRTPAAGAAPWSSSRARRTPPCAS